MSQSISRRNVLRGAGALVALPFLESLAAASPLKPSAARPIRMGFAFVPNGINMEHWRPTAPGKLDQLPKTLMPLQKHTSRISVLTGLSQMKAFANGDGPGDHARSAATWLTGVQARKTAGSDIKVGVSIDQLAAQRLGGKTQFASLEIGCERGALAGNCDSGYSCAYSSAISWRGESTPNPKEVNPRILFERLFGQTSGLESAEIVAKRRDADLSILDFVMDDAVALQKRLGARDLHKIEEYLGSIRDLEIRLANYEKQNKAQLLEGIQTPKGVPQDRGEHIRLMGDMMILAFQADLTRICTFMFANEGSNRPYQEIGIADGHHDVSHHGKSAEKLQKKSQIDLYHTHQLAYIVDRMSKIDDGNGTLLDNTVLLFGGGISDGDRHNHDDLPLLLIGKGGGRVPVGQHLVYQNGTPLTNLFLNMLDLVGVDAENFGDSTGKLQGLF
jgi:hypothetical protein